MKKEEDATDRPFSKKEEMKFMLYVRAMLDKRCILVTFLLLLQNI